MSKRTTTLAILFLCALPVVSNAQVPRELKKAMQERLDAVWRKDAEKWASLTADEFTIVVPEGTLMNKAERIAALKTEKPEPGHEVHPEQIRVYGHTAIHRFLDGTEWVLEVWVRRNAVWRVVATQVNFTKP